MFVIFWKSEAPVIEMESAGYHRRPHSADDLVTATTVQYSPAIISISHIIKATIKILEETDQNKVGVDFYVLIPSTVPLKLPPIHENCRREEQCGGALPFKRKLISQSYQYNDLPYGHWCAHVKKL